MKIRDPWSPDYIVGTTKFGREVIAFAKVCREAGALLPRLAIKAGVARFSDRLSALGMAEFRREVERDAKKAKPRKRAGGAS